MFHYTLYFHILISDPRFTKIKDVICKKSHRGGQESSIFNAVTKCWDNPNCYGVYDPQCGTGSTGCRGTQEDRNTKNVYKLCVNDDETNWPSKAIDIQDDDWKIKMNLTSNLQSCVYLRGKLSKVPLIPSI